MQAIFLLVVFQLFGGGVDGGFDGGEGIIGQAQKSWWQKLAFLWGNNALKYKQMAKNNAQGERIKGRVAKGEKSWPSCGEEIR